MRRLLFVLALVCLATGAFAGDVSVGVGVSGSYFSSDLKYQFSGLDADELFTEIPWNFTAFVDSTYLQVAVGYKFFNGVRVKNTPPLGFGSPSESSDKSKYSYVTFAGYGKFPMRLGSITLIPMIGVEYDLTVDATDDLGNSANSQQKSDLNALWIKGGLGAEIPVNSTFYIRPELLIGYQLNNKSDRDSISALELAGADAGSVSMLTLSVELAVMFGVRL